MPYLLDLKKLEPGDIILESGSTKFSPIIKTVTVCHYSHAMLYIGGSVIHAVTDGVYSKNPQRILVENKNDLKVLRLKSPLTKKSRDAIITHARNLSGSLYSVPEAGASLVLGKVDKEAIATHQFCSRLVAQSYLQGGISIVKNPDYCSPKNINNSKKLTEITDCTKEASDEEISFAESEDPIKENQRRMFEWLNKARDSFKAHGVVIQSGNDVENGLQSHPDLDEEISKYIKDSGYLEHYDYDKTVNPYRYDANLFIETIGSHSDRINIFFHGLNMEHGEILRHSQSHFSSGLNYANLGLEYHLLHHKLYKNLLSMSYERLLVLNEFSKLIDQKNLQDICDYLISYVEKLIFPLH